MFHKSKKQLSEEEKSQIKQVALFYEKYSDMFVNFSNINEKRELVKKIYKILNYDGLPQLYSALGSDVGEGISIFRGISANNEEELKEYANQFINGDVFYGGRASIYGTGIYTVLGNEVDVASKYASDGNTNDCGIVIESKLQKDSKIIEHDNVDEVRNFIFEKMGKMYKKGIENFLTILEDDGVLAAILGYDAIFVKDKDYMVVLNRKNMIVNDVDMLNKFNYNSK